MTFQDAKPLQLFDLLAREWMLPSAVEGAIFNHCDSAVAIACSDGTISIISTKDEESPNIRLHSAIDTGVQTIRPRQGDIPPVKKIECDQQRTSPVVAFGENSFLFGRANGQLAEVSPQGDVNLLDTGIEGAVIAVASRSDGSMSSCATGKDILICSGENLKARFEIQTDKPVVALAFSPDGHTLSAAHEAGISMWNVGDKITKSKEYPLDHVPDNLWWSADGKWIACTMAASGFVLINTKNGWTRQFSDFPTPVKTLSFSAAANAVATSGAFRAAAWSLAQLDKTEDDKGALRSGKPGLVLVDSVAANPVRNLLAVGYANGLLCLTQIDQPEEMLLSQDNGVGIPILSWSKKGDFLAVGKSNDTIALVEFPRGMFK